MKHFYLIALIFSLIACKPQKEYYVKTVTFPEGATPEMKIDMASRVVPTQAQQEWQQLELTAFVHFGMNTFTNREWGDGTEDPALFNPTDLDCEQWVKALQAGGFKMIILTAKHHDGFCLWPTKTTAHSVASSPWKDGKGDVVGELKKACDKYGMKFGVYLSPWDRNAPCYGDSPVYNRMFVDQLTELLSNYGRVDEVWFDGANAEGPNGKKQIYDWKAFNATIDSLQPNAVKAIMGDDVRWVGNERGLGRETEWSVTPYAADSYENAQKENQRLGLKGTAKDLGSREKVLAANRLFWYPSEVDVSIRPGWFYHADQDAQVKTLAQLCDIYFQSVGYNSVLLLNVPPDTRGRISDSDANRLKEFGDYIKTVFAENYLIGGDEAKQIERGTGVEYAVNPDKPINVFLVGEDISKGQRAETFVVEAWVDDAWKELGRGTTIGYKRMLRFPECKASKLRFSLFASRGTINLRCAGAYYAPDLNRRGVELKYSDVPVDNWKILAADSETAGYEAGKAIDNDPATCWKSAESTDGHHLDVDMGQRYELKGFTYAPVSTDDKAGTVFLYRFYVSEDGKTWTLCENGEFSNIKNNPIPQTVRFARSYPARYFRFESIREIDSRAFITVGEIGVVTESRRVEESLSR